MGDFRSLCNIFLSYLNNSSFSYFVHSTTMRYLGQYSYPHPYFHIFKFFSSNSFTICGLAFPFDSFMT